MKGPRAMNEIVATRIAVLIFGLGGCVMDAVFQYKRYHVPSAYCFGADLVEFSATFGLGYVVAMILFLPVSRWKRYCAVAALSGPLATVSALRGEIDLQLAGASHHGNSVAWVMGFVAAPLMFGAIKTARDASGPAQRIDSRV